MVDVLRIALNGQSIEIRDVCPDTTLLDWLREHADLRGTKEGCAEGDCGACTVVVERLTPEGTVQNVAINACIALVGQLDGLGVRTIEGLAQSDGRLHPVQDAFANGNATQCGFCTPGFVMAAYALWVRDEAYNLPKIHDAIAGNLCRCTGYRSIVEAMMQAGARQRPPQDGADTAFLQQLRNLARSEGTYFESGNQRFYAPVSLAEALELRAACPDALLLAGGTDLGLLASQKRQKLPLIIHLSKVKELNVMVEGPTDVTIGAAVTYADTFGALVRLYPNLGGYLTQLGSTQIRNMGTIGGNIATASPVGDMLPVLIALDAKVKVSSAARGHRFITLDKFLIGYRKTALAPDELIEAIIVPKLAKHVYFFTDKISKRRDQDISTICGAYRLLIQDGIVREARIAFGGLAAKPQRAVAVEQALTGRLLDDTAVAKAGEMMHQDFQPVSDWRASAEYQLVVAKNLLHRLHSRIATPDALSEVDVL